MFDKVYLVSVLFPSACFDGCTKCQFESIYKLKCSKCNAAFNAINPFSTTSWDLCRRMYINYKHCQYNYLWEFLYQIIQCQFVSIYFSSHITTCVTWQSIINVLYHHITACPKSCDLCSFDTLTDQMTCTTDKCIPGHAMKTSDSTCHGRSSLAIQWRQTSAMVGTHYLCYKDTWCHLPW